MQIRPYGFLKFEGAERLSLCNSGTFSGGHVSPPLRLVIINLRAQAGRFVRRLNFRADIYSCRLTYWLNRRLYTAPTVFVNLKAQSGLHNVTTFVAIATNGGSIFQQPHITGEKLEMIQLSFYNRVQWIIKI